MKENTRKRSPPLHQKAVQTRLMSYSCDNSEEKNTLLYCKVLCMERQHQSDDKWKHDFYEDVKGPQVSKTKVGSRDLRLMLQKKASQQAYQGGRESGVRDLREKLSGTVNLQTVNVNPSKAKAAPAPAPAPAPAKAAPESAKPVRKSAPSAEATVADTKKFSALAASSKKSQKKSDVTVDGLLRSLGLEKYSIQFQAEEVDMTALMHMTDDDLKALGVPMGPRKKILLALDSRASSGGSSA